MKASEAAKITQRSTRNPSQATETEKKFLLEAALGEVRKSAEEGYYQIATDMLFLPVKLPSTLMAKGFQARDCIKIVEDDLKKLGYAFKKSKYQISDSIYLSWTP